MRRPIVVIALLWMSFSFVLGSQYSKERNEARAEFYDEPERQFKSKKASLIWKKAFKKHEVGRLSEIKNINNRDMLSCAAHMLNL